MTGIGASVTVHRSTQRLYEEKERIFPFWMISLQFAMCGCIRSIDTFSQSLVKCMLSYLSELCANTIIHDAMLLMNGSVAAAISVLMNSNSGELWLGLHRTDHRWLWTDNSAVDFTKWSSREPSPGVRAHFAVVFKKERLY